MQIYNSSSKTKVYTTGTYKRFYIETYVTADSLPTRGAPLAGPFGQLDTNVFPVERPFDPSQVTCVLTLHRNKYAHVIFNSNLQVLSAATTYTESRWDNMDGRNAMVLDDGRQTQRTKGVLCYCIEIPDFINLKDDDRLELYVNVAPSAFAIVGQNGEPNLIDTESYVQVETKTEIGRGVSIPKIEVHNISQGNSNDQFHLGDNVTKAMFIDVSKNSSLYSDRIIEHVMIKSNKLTDVYRFDKLLHKRCEEFEDGKIAMTRNQSFRLYTDNDLQNVDIDIDFNQPNIELGKHYLVVDRCFNDTTTQARYIAMKYKHDAEDLKHATRYSG